MIKTLIQNARQFANYKKNRWKNNQYNKFVVGKPDHFPCVAIWVVEELDKLGTLTTIDIFVYVSDFVAERSKTPLHD